MNFTTVLERKIRFAVTSLKVPEFIIPVKVSGKSSTFSEVQRANVSYSSFSDGPIFAEKVTASSDVQDVNMVCVRRNLSGSEILLSLLHLSNIPISEFLIPVKYLNSSKDVIRELFVNKVPMELTVI